VDLFLPRGAPPAVVRFLAFRNHYAHAVTVRARDAHGTWRDVLRDTRLMADPHYEDDATQIAVLELPNEGVSLDGRDESAVRVYFSNPSPRWAHVEVGASHFAAYESGDPEVMLAELTRRVQRAIREARAGGRRGRRADKSRRKTKFSSRKGNRRLPRVAGGRGGTLRARRHALHVGRPVSFRRARRVRRRAPRASRRGSLEDENARRTFRGFSRRRRRKRATPGARRRDGERSSH
jgi:hypothetical protein